ncbi:MAG: DNA topoisomerase I [Candidatus Komeilibacteria bacterium RIFOXYC1_FULL_37_11]|uniref:DNA topoisomerase 1 n=1 Tax=Candidatus Komeilibacteria bacterium RIFOXYC1_FULL_37_11 TaxID=1798555 RepID=A0A1G2BY54_9BACT|nr:MAG: DNA topoisomerase I [Candidatus Komeilibacteria bacterium RIFOXYC1_FULL_37_11]OGY95256.1 MAG: DNA topoisomerase I [Candidatus Komeilibacteria bacterium RIFOXYD1_FULL_37_29]
MPKLVIVESPTKAKTIKGFLGKEYVVESSFGHVRDLPKSKLGVDVENNFEPTYTVPLKAKKQVSKLKKLAEDAEMVYFATDEDREGEAISWHLQKLLDVPTSKQKRIAFHEITKKAILEALNNPRKLDINLFHAQQARRILDRLVGYKLSPLLWKKVTRGLSAGRVQSVAVRLIVEREEERRKFKTEEYWTVEGQAFKKDSDKFNIFLYKEKDDILKKFDLDESRAKKALEEIKAHRLVIADVKATENKKSPLPPFTTSTLQQDANRRFGYSAKQTMVLAQQLYEGIKLGTKGSHGLITYMRTDSLNLSDSFKEAANTYVSEKLGTEFIMAGGRNFKKKTKFTQEAHEAIRPTEVYNDPESVKDYLDPKQLKIYTLIWQRAVASQMSDAITETTTALIKSVDTAWELKAVGTVTKFAGWKAIYKNNGDENELPNITTGDTLELASLDALEHFTTPPARYSEAGLVKALEALGIGRPSTYAPTIATIIERQYVTKEEKRLAPTEIAEIVNKLLTEHFPDIVSYDFTAQMENDLDEIAEGKKQWQPIIANFYKPFEKNLMLKEKELDKKELTETATDEKCDKCGSAMVIKLGRFGKFMACSNYPECKNTKPIGEDGKAEEVEKIDELCPSCGKSMIVKTGRFGKFIACSDYPKCKTTKNKSQGTGVKCGLCETGEMVAKRSKKGKIFYGCNNYPKCEHLLWGKPTGNKCPECSKLLYQANKSTIKCEDCEYSEKS